jgi:D-alanyl-D-alanine carboxypeptidase (penicillin-binding protein 5/6)
MTAAGPRARRAALLEWGFAAFDETPLIAAGAHIGEARVQGAR